MDFLECVWAKPKEKKLREDLLTKTNFATFSGIARMCRKQISGNLKMVEEKGV